MSGVERMSTEISRSTTHPEQKALARVFSSVRLLGPPMSDELQELVCHLFSPEEARIARHLPFYLPGPIRKIARRAGLSPREIAPFLEAMSQRRVIASSDRGYALLPLIPGMFERSEERRVGKEC